MKIEDINEHARIGPGPNGYLTDTRDIIPDDALSTKTKHDDNITREYQIRPWGTYTVLDDCTGYKVKKITMNVGGSISLQFHNHRSEHWIFVDGVAEVVIDGEVTTLYPNESVYIIAGQIHKCTNIGSIPLNFIEVQTGSYTEEDDIVRLNVGSNKTFGDIL